MASESKSSKTGSSFRNQEGIRPGDIDDSLGYVSLQEIRNVRRYRVDLLDSEIWPREGRMPGRQEMIDFFITTMVDLESRAKRSYDEFVKKTNYPTSKKATPDPAAQAAEQAAYEARRSRLAQYK